MNPDGSYSKPRRGKPLTAVFAEEANKNENKNRRRISNTVAERDKAPTLGGAVCRKEEGVPRIVVRFTGRRVRPLDPDNFAGSVKDLLDGCRHAGLIPGDEPWRIRLETEQEKVAHFSEEETIIEISTHE